MNVYSRMALTQSLAWLWMKSVFADSVLCYWPDCYHPAKRALQEMHILPCAALRHHTGQATSSAHL